MAKKMFGLHGLVTPGQEETLNTKGGLMYYQYDGRRTVTELTDRSGSEIEHYRYDAFGNIYTGITAPYNTIGYTGQEYDDKSGLIYLTSRWYNSDIGRFMTEDTYTGSQYAPQSLNRYAYAMNNPVNMWDPTGNAPSWVGESTHLEFYSSGSDNGHLAYEYILQNHWAENGPIVDGGKETLQKEVIYHYDRTVYQTWVYSYTHCYNYRIVTEFTEGPCPTPIEVERCDMEPGSETFTDVFYDPVTVRIPASDISKQNQQEIDRVIREHIGQLPKNSKCPVEWDISANLIVNGKGSKYDLKITEKTVKNILNNTPNQTVGNTWLGTAGLQMYEAGHYILSFDKYKNINDPVAKVYMAWNDTRPDFRIPILKLEESGFFGTEFYLRLSYLYNQKKIDITKLEVHQLDAIYEVEHEAKVGMITAGVDTAAISYKIAKGVINSVDDIAKEPAKSEGKQLINTLKEILKKKAGFKNEGTPIIIDNSVGTNPTKLAELLRAKEYNVRSVIEIFGKDPKDPAIKQLAEQLGGKVVAADRGRDIAGGFGSSTISVPQTIKQVESFIRLIEEALK